MEQERIICFRIRSTTEQGFIDAEIIATSAIHLFAKNKSHLVVVDGMSANKENGQYVETHPEMLSAKGKAFCDKMREIK